MPPFSFRNLEPHSKDYLDKQTKQLKQQFTKPLSTEQHLFLLHLMLFRDQDYNDGKSISVGSWLINVKHNTVNINIRKLLKGLKLIAHKEEFHLERLLLLKSHRKLRENHQGEKLVQIHDHFQEVIHLVKYILNPVTIGSLSTCIQKLQ